MFTALLTMLKTGKSARTEFTPKAFEVWAKVKVRGTFIVQETSKLVDTVYADDLQDAQKQARLYGENTYVVPTV